MGGGGWEGMCDQDEEDREVTEVRASPLMRRRVHLPLNFQPQSRGWSSFATT